MTILSARELIDDYPEDAAQKLEQYQTDLGERQAEVQSLRAAIREVRDEMLCDGYHRPNALILKLDAALGEDHE